MSACSRPHRLVSCVPRIKLDVWFKDRDAQVFSLHRTKATKSTPFARNREPSWKRENPFENLHSFSRHLCSHFHYFNNPQARYLNDKYLKEMCVSGRDIFLKDFIDIF